MKQGVDDWLAADGPEPVLKAMEDAPVFTPSAENIISIVEALPDKPSLSHIQRALENASGIVDKVNNALTRELVRDGLKAALKARGVTSPGKIVDAAFSNGDEATIAAAGKFEDPEPWPEPVNGALLLDEIVAVFQRYVFADTYVYWAVALWALFSHCFQSVYVYPILSITAATKKAGKTTLMQVLSAIVRRPFLVVSMTAAVFYRICERYEPSTLMDEADRFLNDNPELCGLINSGHTPGTVVPRCVGEDHEVEWFTTRMPLAISGIGKRAETIADRAITIAMRRQAPTERREHLRLDRLSDLEPLRQKAARWTLDHADVLKIADPTLPDELTDDRARDNWRTLIMIADAAGGEWPLRARRAALALTENEDENQSISEQLINDLFTLFNDEGHQDCERIESSEIAAYLHKLENRPWAEWGRAQRPIAPAGIARLLRDHLTAKGKPLKPDHWRDGPDKTIRGWRREDLQDVFDRYCRGNRNGTSAQDLRISTLQEFKTAQPGQSVPSGNGGKPLQTTVCAGVPDRQTLLDYRLGVDATPEQRRILYSGGYEDSDIDSLTADELARFVTECSENLWKREGRLI